MKQKKRAMRLGTIIGSVCLLLILTVGSAQATPLNLILFDFPDISSAFIDVTYGAGSDTFAASGFAQELDDDGIGSPEAIAGGTFDINASINSSGVASGGTLTIGGTIASLSFNTGTLLTGILTAFGFPNAGGDPFEFLFEVTGGDAAGLYGSLPAGVILSGTKFGGSFNVDFDNLSGGLQGTGLAFSNTAPVPEPGTLLLLLSGIGVLFGLRKRLRVVSPDSKF